MRRMTITFGEYDTDVETFLKNQKNASALVRHLVRNYMNNTNIPYNGQDSSSDNKVTLENLLNLMVGNMVGRVENQDTTSKEEEQEETIKKKNLQELKNDLPDL